MSANGVFCYVVILIAVFSCTTLAQTEYSLMLDGELAWDHPIPSLTWKLDLSLSPQHKVRGNFVSNPSPAWEEWHFASESVYGTWDVFYNSPHVTSNDIFRIFHRNSYNPHSLVLSYDHHGIQALVGDRVVTGEGLESKLCLLQGGEIFSDTQVHATALVFDSTPQWFPFATGWDFLQHRGAVGVVQGTRALSQGELVIGYGLNYDYWDKQGIITRNQDQAWVLRLSGKRDNLSTVWSVVSIGDDFSSPLAQHKPYPAGRRGVSGSWTWQEEDVRLRYSFEAYRQSAADRMSSDLLLRFGFLETRIRWLPTPQFRFHAHLDNLGIQWIVDDNRVRFDYSLGSHDFVVGGRFYGPYRVEWEYANQHKIGLVWKIQPTTGEQYHFARMRLGDEQRWLELSYGTYDRRNIDAHFQTSPSIRLSWGYLF